MFITFEGIDFCGKSTQVKLLKDYFKSKNREVVVIREPGGTTVSEIIRDILLDKKNSELSIESEIFLFSASRSQLVKEKILPLLKSGVIVISDRFHDSTTAYQGYGRGISLEAVEQINKLAIQGAKPDLTFFIDITVEEAESRKLKLSEGKSLDRIELSKEDFFIKVRNGYLQIAEQESRFRVINGMRPIETIHKNIVNEIEIYEREERLYD